MYLDLFRGGLKVLLDLRCPTPRDPGRRGRATRSKPARRGPCPNSLSENVSDPLKPETRPEESAAPPKPRQPSQRQPSRPASTMPSDLPSTDSHENAAPPGPAPIGWRMNREIAVAAKANLLPCSSPPAGPATALRERKAAHKRLALDGSTVDTFYTPGAGFSSMTPRSKPSPPARPETRAHRDGQQAQDLAFRDSGSPDTPAARFPGPSPYRHAPTSE